MSNVVSCIFGWNGLDRAVLGILGCGQRLAKQVEAKHCIFLLGESTEASLSELARFADSLHVARHPLLAKYHGETTLAALTQACGTLQPFAILLGNDTYSQELAPRLAHRFRGSAAGDAISLEVNTGSILVNRPVHGRTNGRVPSGL